MRRRIFAALVAAFMLVGMVGLLAACGGADVADHALVGTWSWNTAPGYQLIFNEDGTGTRGGAGNPVESFTWSAPSDGRLRINRDNAPSGEIRREQWDYSFGEGNALTIHSRQNRDLRYTYSRVGAAPEVTDPAQNDPTDAPPVANGESALAGTTWNWEDNAAFQYVFNADGTGQRGGGGATVEQFNWSAEGDHLQIESPDGEVLMFNVAQESWTYDILDGTLTLESRQGGGTYVYVLAD